MLRHVHSQLVPKIADLRIIDNRYLKGIIQGKEIDIVPVDSLQNITADWFKAIYRDLKTDTVLLAIVDSDGTTVYYQFERDLFIST